MHLVHQKSCFKGPSQFGNFENAKLVSVGAILMKFGAFVQLYEQ